MDGFGYPRQSGSQQKGLVGAATFTLFVEQELGWIFRPNHQEHDFGIDGYIDILEGGNVTGRSLAVQIKCGDSYFSSKTPKGYKYKGENRHLNFYLNLPVPIILVMISGNGSVLYWTKFEIEKTSPISNGWWIEIPKSNVLSIDVKDDWISFSGTTTDHSDRIRSIWRQSQLFEDANIIHVAIPLNDIIIQSCSTINYIIEKISKNSSLLINKKNCFEIFFPDYDDDPREVYDIPEISDWIKSSIEQEIPWFYLLRAAPPYNSLTVLVTCATKIDGAQVQQNLKYKVRSSKESLTKFFNQNWINLNRFTEENHIDETINRSISKKIKAAYQTMWNDAANFKDWS